VAVGAVDVAITPAPEDDLTGFRRAQCAGRTLPEPDCHGLGLRVRRLARAGRAEFLMLVVARPGMTPVAAGGTSLIGTRTSNNERFYTAVPDRKFIGRLKLSVSPAR